MCFTAVFYSVHGVAAMYSTYVCQCGESKAIHLHWL